MPSATTNILSHGFFVFGLPKTICCRISPSKCIISKHILSIFLILNSINNYKHILISLNKMSCVNI